MSDRDRFRQLNDLLTHGQALTGLISPYGSDEQFWPRNAAPPWPQAYAAWYDACRAALDPDLWDLFAAINAGDWQRPGVRQVVERLAARLTAPAEQVEAARTALRDVTSRRSLWSLFTPQQEIVETARRRAFTPTDAIPARIKQIVAAAQYRRREENIDQLFVSSGCERHWWVRPFQAYDSQNEWRVAGWFTAIQMYAPERERTIVRRVVTQVLGRGRLRGDKRPTLEQFLAEPQPAAPTAALAPTPTAATLSCFISYSSHDEAIARRLAADLQAHDVRCWFAPHDMQIGSSILDSIDQAIRTHQRLLLILSAASLASRWVETEVKTALARERSEGGQVLFPIRIDDAIQQAQQGWAAQLWEQRHIGDFQQCTCTPST